MTYLDFFLYVRVTLDFLALLSFIEFLELVASSAYIRSSASAMVDGSHLIPEIFLFAFFVALETCSRVDGGRDRGEAEFV